MAVITLTTDAANAARLATAVGRDQGLKDAAGAPRDATLAEVKAWFTAYAVRTVQDTERVAAQNAIVISPPAIS